MDTTTLRQYGTRLKTIVEQALGAGPAHRRRLADTDIRIAVSGARGKSTTVRWLHDVFHERGYDTYAKVTGTAPRSIYNGTEHEIPRPSQVRLYENEREFGKYDPDDVAIFENQGIREYTTRLVNQQFVRPDVVFLTNVREDHLGTLGTERYTIARSLARAVPRGTHVVSGEQDPTVRRYLAAELQRRDASVTHVELPSALQTFPGAECVYGINDVLQWFDEPPLDQARIDTYLETFDVSWRRLDSGRLFNAADANDVQSTELIRRTLLDDETTAVEPVLFLRWDRRGRTASFLHYLDRLADTGDIEQAHVLGANRRTFARRASVPVVTHDHERTDPSAVLDEALASDRPVLVMGNTVHPFMQSLQEEIEARVVEHSQHEHRPGQELDVETT